MKKLCKILLGICGLLFLAVPSALAEPVAGKSPSFGHAEAVIQKPDGKQNVIIVAVATTPEQQAYGLMFQKYITPREGMFFIYAPAQKVSFWMKNTYIPLDLLFVGPDNRIVKIIAEAKPLDETPLPSDVPVVGVLEIKGGEAAKQGFAVGQTVMLREKQIFK